MLPSQSKTPISRGRHSASPQGSQGPLDHRSPALFTCADWLRLLGSRRDQDRKVCCAPFAADGLSSQFQRGGAASSPADETTRRCRACQRERPNRPSTADAGTELATSPSRQPKPTRTYTGATNRRGGFFQPSRRSGSTRRLSARPAHPLSLGLVGDGRRSLDAPGRFGGVGRGDVVWLEAAK